jgi:hypothetical protein
MEGVNYAIYFKSYVTVLKWNEISFVCKTILLTDTDAKIYSN